MVSFFVVCGCKTRSLSNIQPIPILEGMTSVQVLDAVAAASNSEPEQKRTGLRPPIQSYEDGIWAVEDRKADCIVVSYSIGKRNVVVRYTVDGRTLVPTVESGVNVAKGETRIHSNAIAWINRHATEIKAAMYKVKSGAK